MIASCLISVLWVDTRVALELKSDDALRVCLARKLNSYLEPLTVAAPLRLSLTQNKIFILYF